MDSPAPPPPPPPIGLDSLQAPAIPPPVLGRNSELGLGPPPTSRDSFIPGPPSPDRLSFNHARSQSPGISPPPPPQCGSTPQAAWLHLLQAVWPHLLQAAWLHPPSSVAPPLPSSVAPPPPSMRLPTSKQCGSTSTPIFQPGATEAKKQISVVLHRPGTQEGTKSQKAGPPGFVTAPP